MDWDDDVNGNVCGDGEWRSCCDCRTAFAISEGEAKWFAGRGYPLPRRCVACRALKRARNQRQQYYGDDAA